MTKSKLTCISCGYHMDAIEAVGNPAAVPKTGDLSFCINCGALYSFRGGATPWTPLSRKERRKLPKLHKAWLAHIEKRRRIVITEDLAFNQALRRGNQNRPAQSASAQTDGPQRPS